MNENIAIKVEGLTKIYPIYNNKNDRMKEALSLNRRKYHTDFHALNNISFEVKKGETVGIIGQNGSGKSTLLKILTGVLSPTSGSVTVNGKVSALLELGAGFNPEMTGMENIYLNGTIMGYTKEEMDDRVPQIVKFADIGEFINQPVKMYSSGMFVRLAFAVAINVEPDIFIIDEALAVGDALFQRKCFAKIAELKKKKVTIIFVSHDKNSVIELCEQAIFLNKGEKILFGNSAEIVGLYDKFLNLSKNEQDSFVNTIYKDGIPAVRMSLHNRSAKNQLQNTLDEAFYDKSLVSEKGVHYEKNGAEIFNCKIINSNNRVVNVLLKGETYYWIYSVRFDEDFSDVNFGMLIKTQKGIELGGSVIFNNHKSGIDVKKGEVYTVSFEFVINLNPNIYFLNCGVSSDKGAFHFLDRKTDIIAFRVEADGEYYSTGIVDMGIKGIVSAEG